MPVRTTDPRRTQPLVDRQRTETTAPAAVAQPATTRIATPAHAPAQARRHADAFEAAPRRGGAHEAPAQEPETNAGEFNGTQGGFENFATRGGVVLSARGSSTSVRGRGEVSSRSATLTVASHGHTTETTARDSRVTLANGRTSSRSTEETSEPEHEGGLRHAAREAEVGANLVGVSREGSVAAAHHTFGSNPDELHDTGAGLEVSAGRLAGSVGAGATANLREARLNAGASASGSADAVRVTGHAQLGNSERVAAVAHGEARVGANAAASAGVEVDPRHGTATVRAGAQAFAGAEATGHVGVESRYGGVAVEGQAQAGIGAGASAEVGFSHGSVHAHVDVGACVGLGGHVAVNVDVNVVNIAKDGWHAASNFVHNHHLW